VVRGCGAYVRLFTGGETAQAAIFFMLRWNTTAIYYKIQKIVKRTN